MADARAIRPFWIMAEAIERKVARGETLDDIKAAEGKIDRMLQSGIAVVRCRQIQGYVTIDPPAAQ